ncbi:hypothetical protein ATY41_06005 [Leifsonia xyli subsp. xyli]|uniref:Uncharacterized protein n=1 Tax=Leifsonia xyli subsp. xyli TaxID=59736 RepID=A0A1E2SHX0_LEIXY|nr:hypothetical protein ATY41_06005 [Leifsonia xyli subsp. xyli]
MTWNVVPKTSAAPGIAVESQAGTPVSCANSIAAQAAKATAAMRSADQRGTTRARRAKSRTA